MPKPNYSFEKRQRELEKKRKKAEKAERKSNPRPADSEAPAETGEADAVQTAGQEPPKE
jgi:hypothetical protein